MKADRSVRERAGLEKGLRLSRRALPAATGFALVSIGLLWRLHLLGRLPTWAAYLIGFLAGFGAVGDALNVVYSRRRLRRSDQGGAGSKAP